jgi:tripartite-type tricarboxylate transporter receptor subunit TctC
MFSRRVLLSAAVFALESVAIHPALGAESAARTYPSKPIRMVVPFTAGSATDIMVRLIGPEMARNWGHQVVVDNRPGAGGAIAGGIVVTAVPDGHTILVTSSAFAGSAALYDNLPYDPLKDFQGVTQLASSSLVLVVAPGLGVKSAKELIALAQQKPGQFSFSSAGIGSGTHYGGERFKLAARIDAVHVPYKGTPEALNDTVGGRVQYSMTSILPSVPLIKSGRLLALAVSTPYRAAPLPDVPTFAELGLPDAECDGWYGVFVQPRTPRSIVNALSKEIARILELPDVQEKIAAQGARVKHSTPEAFDTMVRAEILLRRKIFGASGAKAE